MKILSGAKDIYLLSLESTTENFLRKSSDPIQKKLLFTYMESLINTKDI